MLIRLKSIPLGPAIALLALLTGLFSCATAPDFEPVPREPLGVIVEGPYSRYLVEVTYITQDDIGIATDYHEIRGEVIHAPVDGVPYYRWDSYETRAWSAGDQPPAFQTFEPAVGFEYFKPDELSEDMTTIADTSSLPRTMDGFEFYLNLIDFHTWDVYRNIFVFDEETALGQPGDFADLDLTGTNLNIGSWENITRDFVMTAGRIHGEYLGQVRRGDAEFKLIAFYQEQTHEQTVVGLGFEMPYRGTNRFGGLMYLDPDDSLAMGTFTEYAYGKVWAPMDQVVVVHTERRYSIRKIEHTE